MRPWMGAPTSRAASRGPRQRGGMPMSDERARAFVLRPGEGRDIDMGNFRMSLKASADDTANAFTLLEAEEPPNFGPPMHIHQDAAEAFYVVSGEYRIFIGDDEHICPAG